MSRRENLGSWCLNQEHSDRVRSGTWYPNSEPSLHSITFWNFSQLLPTCSVLPCTSICLPGRQDDADRHGQMGLWSSGWLGTCYVGELTVEAFFLPSLFCPPYRNQTLSPGNYASFSNAMLHQSSNPTYGLLFTFLGPLPHIFFKWRRTVWCSGKNSEMTSEKQFYSCGLDTLQWFIFLKYMGIGLRNLLNENYWIYEKKEDMPCIQYESI